MVETNNKEFNTLHCVDFLQDRCEKHMHFIVCHVACVFKCFVNQFFIEFSICLFFVWFNGIKYCCHCLIDLSFMSFLFVYFQFGSSVVNDLLKDNFHDFEKIWQSIQNFTKLISSSIDFNVFEQKKNENKLAELQTIAPSTRSPWKEITFFHVRKKLSWYFPVSRMYLFICCVILSIYIPADSSLLYYNTQKVIINLWWRMLFNTQIYSTLSIQHRV